MTFAIWYVVRIIGHMYTLYKSAKQAYLKIEVYFCSIREDIYIVILLFLAQVSGWMLPGPLLYESLQRCHPQVSILPQSYLFSR